MAAFDELARAGGFPTFDLSRYFAFEYSVGAAPVPEPATGLLFLAGLAVVLVALRRRSLQRVAPRLQWDRKLSLLQPDGNSRLG